MWLFTTVGFFSIVQKPGSTSLTLRARVKSDLDALRTRYLPELTPTLGKAGTDYPWRATATHAQFAAALTKIVSDLHYDNFKNAVAKTQGNARARRYHQVWDVLCGMKDEPAPVPAGDHPWPATPPRGKKIAYGGVVFDPAGNVLLREPRNHYDGYVWSFAKGRPDPGETPEQTALRETREETGVEATIVCPIPDEFVGGTTINRYFLMQAPAGASVETPDCPETQSIRWVTPETAESLIALTTNALGRARDLAVLDAAVECWSALPR